MFNIVTFVMRLFDFYQILIVIWCILSWIPIPRDGLLGDIVGALNSIVSPYINLFRRFIPPLAGIDFSPILAVLVLQLIERFVLGMLI